MQGTKASSLVIIGGGFAGSVTALKIIEGSHEPLDLTLVEPAERLGRGIAYSTDDPDHVVNGLAGGFALDPERPERFVRWLEAQGAAGVWSPPIGMPLVASSPPRGLYGAYVESELGDAVQRSVGRVRFAHVRDRVVDVDGAELTLASGRRLTAAQVVLATGLYRREPRLGAGIAGGHRAYVRDVFDPGAYDGASRASHALLLGSGLTMLDALIGFEKAGFRGTYTVISRRGLLVEPRREVDPWPSSPGSGERPATAREVLRWVQRERCAVRAAGADWQRLPLLFREHTSAIWSRVDDRERARLLRHLVSFWNLSQHRAAPSSFAWLERVRSEGRLVNLAATVTALEAAGEGVRAHLRLRGRPAAKTIRADIAVCGLGYEFDWTRIDDPLVRNLLARGLVVPHPVGLGIRVDPSSLGLVDRHGHTSARLFAVGHPLRGELWESSSIRELLDQATRLAAVLNSRVTAVPNWQAA